MLFTFCSRRQQVQGSFDIGVYLFTWKKTRGEAMTIFIERQMYSGRLCANK